MEFYEIPVVLKRYSFDSKMNTSMIFSKRIMDVNGLKDINTLTKNILPWEIEIFALMSTIFEGEYSTKRLEDVKNQKKFFEIMNAIRDFMPPALKKASRCNAFAENFMIVTGLSQFQLQQNIYYTYYRCKFFYTFTNKNVDMALEFKNKFGVEPLEFVNFGYILNFIICGFADENNNNHILKHLFNKYSTITQALSKSRLEQVELHRNILRSIDDLHEFIYCFKYFYQYPFVTNDNNLYIPLPHLILSSTTSSLLYRITEGRNDIREKFGKDVLESYAYHITSLCSYLDEIFPEYEYSSGSKTVDIMCRQDKVSILIDCKAFAPRIALRKLAIEEIDYSINRIAESVVQVFTHITERFLQKYNPFQIESFDRSDIYGIVLISEDNYVRREKIYKRAAEIAGLDLNTKEYLYMCSNIKIMSLYSFEEIIFGEYNMISILESNKGDSSKWFDLLFVDSFTMKPRLHSVIKGIISEIKSLYDDELKELAEH